MSLYFVWFRCIQYSIYEPLFRLISLHTMFDIRAFISLDFAAYNIRYMSLYFAVYLRPSLFCHLTQSMLILPNLGDVPRCRYTNTNIQCVTFQKSEVLRPLLGHTLHLVVYKIYFITLFIMRLSVSQVMQRHTWWTVNNQTQKMCKGAAATKFEVLSLHLSGRTGKKRRKTTQICTYWIGCLTWFTVCLKAFEKRIVSLTASSTATFKYLSAYSIVTTLTGLPRLLISVIFLLPFS